MCLDLQTVHVQHKTKKPTSLKQRNQPALTKLSPTASLVPELSHENNKKDSTREKDGVIFIVEI